MKSELEVVAVVSLALLIALSSYSVLLLRRSAKKLNRNADRVSKELKGQTSQIKNELSYVYQQLEALEQLLPLLKLTAPLPPSRGWAASPDFLLSLFETSKNRKPSMVLELGSGVSTLVLAKSGAKKIISLDHSLEYGEQTRAMLANHKVRGVEIRIDELENYQGGFSWYSRASLKSISKIDLLVIDGPPSATNPDARYPALENLLPLLSPKATIILDDANRADERKLADAFAAALPTHRLRFLHHEKGTAVIEPR
jgi:predicted O-methyltransferase YrrM